MGSHQNWQKQMAPMEIMKSSSDMEPLKEKPQTIRRPWKFIRRTQTPLTATQRRELLEALRNEVKERVEKWKSELPKNKRQDLYGWAINLLRSTRQHIYKARTDGFAFLQLKHSASTLMALCKDIGISVSDPDPTNWPILTFTTSQKDDFLKTYCPKPWMTTYWGRVKTKARARSLLRHSTAFIDLLRLLSEILFSIENCDALVTFISKDIEKLE